MYWKDGTSASSCREKHPVLIRFRLCRGARKTLSSVAYVFRFAFVLAGLVASFYISEIIFDEFPCGGFGLGFGDPPRARPMVKTAPQQEKRSFRFLRQPFLLALEEQQIPFFGTQYKHRQSRIPGKNPEFGSAAPDSKIHSSPTRAVLALQTAETVSVKMKLSAYPKGAVAHMG